METDTYSALFTMQQIRAAHTGHWFDSATMRFFRTRILGRLFTDGTRERTLFVTSEPYCWDGERVYTIRAADWRTGDINTVSEMGQYSSSRSAYSAAARLARP